MDVDIELLQPTAYCEKFIDIDFADLFKKGIRYLIVDLDNTIALRDDMYCIRLDVLEAFRRARRAGIQDICLVSNIGIRRKYLFFGSDRAERVAYFASELGTKYLALTWPNIKPKPAVFYQALDMMGANTYNTAVIGDQIFTDIKGGNRVGCYTILVKSLGKHHWITYLIKGRKEKRVMDQLRISGLVS